MYGEKRQDSNGFTLVEVLVVLAIVALISAIAIPGLAHLGAFSRDEFKRTVTEVDSLLRAAQIYSTTYHVNTAVVYNMDHYSPEEARGITPDVAITDPIIDSLTGVPVRQIEAAAIMYQLPSTMGAIANLYVPVPNDNGEFKPMPSGMSIMLQNPEKIALGLPARYEPNYLEFAWSNYRPVVTENRIGSLGMNSVNTILGIPSGLNNQELTNFLLNSTEITTGLFPAHVFTPAGRLSVTGNFLECGDCDRERFSLFIGPSADRPLDERVVDPESTALLDGNGRSNLLYRKIYLHKSTARTSVPDAF